MQPNTDLSIACLYKCLYSENHRVRIFFSASWSKKSFSSKLRPDLRVFHIQISKAKMLNFICRYGNMATLWIFKRECSQTSFSGSNFVAFPVGGWIEARHSSRPANGSELISILSFFKPLSSMSRVKLKQMNAKFLSRHVMFGSKNVLKVVSIPGGEGYTPIWGI